MVCGILVLSLTQRFHCWKEKCIHEFVLISAAAVCYALCYALVLSGSNQTSTMGWAVKTAKKYLKQKLDF